MKIHCNNYQALKFENTLLKEVNEAQIFTIEKYQKENEDLKEQIKTLNDIIDKAIEKNI
jgi:cell division protein FtsB